VHWKPRRPAHSLCDTRSFLGAAANYKDDTKKNQPDSIATVRKADKEKKELAMRGAELTNAAVETMY
jgi:hypothetical protein